MRSRRNEKNRDASSTVHQLPPLIDITPHLRSRSVASKGKSASHLPAPSDAKRSASTR
jgi:hypothetical protein